LVPKFVATRECRTKESLKDSDVADKAEAEAWKMLKSTSDEGHEALECENKKALNDSSVADKTEAEAWAWLKSASDDRDLDDFKDAVKALIKSTPDYTYSRLAFTDFLSRHPPIDCPWIPKSAGTAI
jgi:hypothetical protein